MQEFWTNKKYELHNKLADFSTQLYERLSLVQSLSIGERKLFATEFFVMRGKGGQSLQRLIGAYYAVLPNGFDVIEVQNTAVKMCIGGSGKDDKRAVAEGVYSWFKGKNKESARMVWNAINEEKWDQLDACAIAITGYLKREIKQ